MVGRQIKWFALAECIHGKLIIVGKSELKKSEKGTMTDTIAI